MTDKRSKPAKAPTTKRAPAKPAGKAPAPRKRTVRAPAPAAQAPEPTHEEIAERAYLIYLDDGGGDPHAHWLRAKSELTKPAS